MAGTTKPTWLIMGDEHIQEMYRFLFPLLRNMMPDDVIDVVGSKDSTYTSWLYGGTPGAVQGQSRSSIQINVQEDKPDVTILVLGSNPGGDIPVGFGEEVRTAVAESARFSGQVVLVGPFANDPAGKRLAAMRRAMPDAIDGALLASGLPRTSDGIHFTRDGYQALTERMVAAIANVLARRLPKPPVAETPLEPTTVTVTPVVEPPPSTTPTPGTTPGEPISVTPRISPMPGATEAKTEPGAPTATGKSRWPWVVGGVVLLGAVGATAYFISRRRKRKA